MRAEVELRVVDAAPDCVLYMPQGCDYDVICRLLESGIALSGRDQPEVPGHAVTVGPGSYTGLRVGIAAALVIASAFAGSAPAVLIDCAW